MSLRVSERALKYIAAFTMLIDHAPYIFPDARSTYYTSAAVWLHAVGRIAAPIFFWFLARGYKRTRNFYRYAARIALFAVITYVPFIYFLDGRMPNAENCLRLNILFTMLAGLVMLRIIETENRLHVKIPVLAVLCLAVTTADYGAFGLMFILAFYMFSDDKKKLAAAYFAIVATYAFGSFLQSFTEYSPRQFVSLLYWNALPGILLVIFAQFLPLALILTHTENAEEPPKKRGFLEKWGFYAWYPAQFILLALIRDYLVF